MLIDFNDFLARNLLSNKYLKPILKKNLYLFLLGFSFSVGDFKLILATVIFILSMVVSYQLKTRSLYSYIRYFSPILTSENKQLVSSITIAGFCSIFVYFSVSIYGELDNTWFALCLIIQTVFSSCGIAFFSKQLFSSKYQQKKQSIPQFDELVRQLHDDSPLHRLWVINQIMNLWQDNQLTPIQVHQLEEYLILLKNLEFEPVILAKIDHSLQELSLTNSQPLNIPRKICTSNHKNPLPVMQAVDSVKGK